MLNTTRRQRIVEIVEAHESVSVNELSEMLGVSTATIRRDMTALSAKGLIERGHGGATRSFHSGTLHHEPPLLHRSTQQADEKRRIGAAAARLVQDGDNIIISGGTTAVEMVPFLADRLDLTVITNALNVALALNKLSSVTVVVLGGTLRHSELSLVGPPGEDAIERFRADKLFMGCAAIHPEGGISAENSAEARVDELLIRAAREVTVLADHTKFGRRSFVRVAPLSRIRRVISGVELLPGEAAPYADEGIELTRA